MSDAQTAVTLNQINLVSSDLAASVDFYRLLGVNIPDTLPEWQQHHLAAATDDASPSGSRVPDFELDSRTFTDDWGSPEIPLGPMLGFGVPSREGVDILYARVTDAGYRGIRAPYDAFWGARYAMVLDPSGVAVGLMSPSDPARRSAMPDPSRFSQGGS